MNTAPNTLTWPKCVCNRPKPTIYQCATLSESIRMARLEKDERLTNANKLAREEVTLVVHNENKTHQEKCDSNILFKLVMVWDCLFHQLKDTPAEQGTINKIEWPVANDLNVSLSDFIYFALLPVKTMEYVDLFLIKTTAITTLLDLAEYFGYFFIVKTALEKAKEDKSRMIDITLAMLNKYYDEQDSLGWKCFSKFVLDNTSFEPKDLDPILDQFRPPGCARYRFKYKNVKSILEDLTLIECENPENWD